MLCLALRLSGLVLVSSAARAGAFLLALLLLPLLLSTPSLAETGDPDAAPLEQTDRWPGRADFWRQVRGGFEGSVNQPKGGVLIRGQGAEWGAVHSTLVLSYGKQLVAVTLGAIAALALFSGRGRRLLLRLAAGVRRLGRIDRLAYGLTAGGFLLLGVTGLIILYGRHMLAPLLGREAFAELAYASKYLHDRVSWAFMAGVVLLVLVWIRDRVPAAPRRSAKLIAPLGASEKLIFWSVILGGIVVSYSGLAMLFPLVFSAPQRMQLMQIVHSLSSLTLASLIFGHVFIAAMSIRENARKLAEAKDELERRVAERTAELAAAKRDAEEANRSKDRFLAAASHDLLQPLSAARLMVAAVRRRNRSAETRELIDMVQASLDGAEDLLAELLDIARLDAEAIAPERQPVSVHELLRGLRAEFLPQARKAGLALRVVDCGLWVDTDPQLLTRVLRNLMANAVRYTPQGRILLGCRRIPGGVRFEVWDTGIGMAPDAVGRIFGEFHREPEAAALRQRGSGLGLAIVERLARVLGHAVSVRSQPGRGSVFAVTVARSGAPAAPAAAPGRSLAGLSVLVIDNDPDLLVAMATLLRDWGGVVTAAGSADAVSDDAGFDVIVADHHLDDEVGPDAVARLRRRFGPLPAVVVTADRSEAVRQHIAAAGLPLLYKPVRPAKLRAVLEHVVRSDGNRATPAASLPAAPPASGSSR